MEVIFEGEIYLERFQGKGGWTFARIPKEFTPTGKYFGMSQVSGRIDDFNFDKKHLMPTGDGTVFIPISKEIRNLIKKEAGEKVYLRVEKKPLPQDTPHELLDCLRDDPGKLQLFDALDIEDKKKWIAYIYQSKDDEVKADRIIQLLNKLN